MNIEGLNNMKPAWIQALNSKPITIMSEQIPQYATMGEVVMKKEELLNRLNENKAKHDVILAVAIEGYWDTAQTRLDERKKKLYEQIDRFKEDAEREFTRVANKIATKEELPPTLALRAISIDSNLGLVYPQDHGKDYERAIKMMELSVFDEVRLSVEEYDCYVLNNWEWKQQFLATNAFYVDTMRSKSGYSGPAGPVGPQGAVGISARSTYNLAVDTAKNNVTKMGCSGF